MSFTPQDVAHADVPPASLRPLPHSGETSRIQEAAAAGESYLAEHVPPASVDPTSRELSTMSKVVACLQLGSASGTSHPAFRRHLAIALGAVLVQGDDRKATAAALPTGGLAPGQLRRAVATLDNPRASVAGAARSCGLSVSHFARAFKANLGMTPHRWHLLKRLELAERQLRETRSTLAEIALDCGFGDQSYFTRVFKRERGSTPGDVRRSAGAKPTVR